jgi:hypothetical protein
LAGNRRTFHVQRFSCQTWTNYHILKPSLHRPYLVACTVIAVVSAPVRACPGGAVIDRLETQPTPPYSFVRFRVASAASGGGRNAEKKRGLSREPDLADQSSLDRDKPGFGAEQNCHNGRRCAKLFLRGPVSG